MDVITQRVYSGKDSRSAMVRSITKVSSLNCLKVYRLVRERSRTESGMFWLSVSGSSL